MKEHPLVLTVEQAAMRLGICRDQAYQGVHSGEIPSIRIGKLFRIPTAALDKLLEQKSNENSIEAKIIEPKKRGRPKLERTHILYHRISEALFQQLHQAAEEQRRTISAEVRCRLEQSFRTDVSEFARWPS